MPRADRWRAAVRSVGRHRRWVSAALIGIAVAVGVGTFAPQPAVGFPVITAARDLPPGQLLSAADVHTERLTGAQRPDGVLTELSAAVGHRLASAIRRGEPLTDVRLDAAGALASPGAGLVAVPVRFADSRAAQLLQPGMRVDVLAATATSTAFGSAAAVAPAVVVAHAVTVLDVPDAGSAGQAGDPTDPLAQDGALVVLATTADQARLLAQAQVSDRLSAINIG